MEQDRILDTEGEWVEKPKRVVLQKTLVRRICAICNRNLYRNNILSYKFHLRVSALCSDWRIWNIHRLQAKKDSSDAFCGTLGSLVGGYAGVSLFMFGEVDNEFCYRFLFPLFLLSGLVTLPFAWFGRWRTPQYSTLRTFFLTYVIYVIIVVPFVFAFAWDYNIRGDTSPPEVVNLKIVAKYVATHDELPDEPTLQVETLDGRSVFFLNRRKVSMLSMREGI